ncbi:Encodes a protein whose expression is responsive to nematode infection [Striga hermonthica]|uniref:Encodes a protein whose expression is responsive to nematode infection n=1 Tax=Striga hermonthica TaxID=68872 RepID=A0A9N7RDJ7_STRHE|nr:Encodes a protein whose expression is responsive to nematode infection [Striga hermonthica]
MGNSLGGKKSAKVMKISGETQKIKTPVRAGSILDACPGHVLLESEAVRHQGLRAKPLEPQQELKPGGVYFLVPMPKDDENRVGARRVRSGIQISAKDRLESLMLSRRSASDLSNVAAAAISAADMEENGGVRVRMRLPKAEVERLMAESKDGADVAEKIAKFYMAAKGGADGDGGDVRRLVKSTRERRVGFMPVSDREIHYLTTAS